MSNSIESPVLSLGNPNELCGNDNTIVVYQILDSRRTYTYARTPAEAYPDFEYDSCIRLNSFNQSSMYQFTMVNRNNDHPRYCLALCEKYDQKYALISKADCLCTNRAMKGDQEDVDILSGQQCDRLCTSNYFYSCGNTNNMTIYSLYILQPKCRHGTLIYFRR